MSPSTIALNAYVQLQHIFMGYVQNDTLVRVQSMISEVAANDEEREASAQKTAEFAQQRYIAATNSKIDGLLKMVEHEIKSFGFEDARNITKMRNVWLNYTALPQDLAVAVAKLEPEGMSLHHSIKHEGDWSKAKPWLEHSFATMAAVAACKQQKFGFATPYEALLDHYSPGLKDETVAREFAVLERELPLLIAAVVEKQKTETPPIPLTGPFPREQQLELNMRLARAFGFDFTRGRVDLIDNSPSCDGTYYDTRATVDFIENDFMNAVYGTAHEVAGHGLYHQGTPKKWADQPVGMIMGLDIDESQARLFEVFVCHVPQFFQFIEQQAREIFNRPDDPALSAENLLRLRTQATPSFVRIYADELTYPVHILLRYKFEKALVNGDMKLDDIPQAWNETMQKMLGITPSNNTEGCMQDVHWPCGYIGYFPAYNMGNMYAAQFFNTAITENPSIPAEIGKGNFKPIVDWVRKNVHEKGSILTQEELVKQATGEQLNAQYYLNHLSQRFLGKPWEMSVAAKPEQTTALKK